MENTLPIKRKFDIARIKTVPIQDIYKNEYNPKDPDSEEYKIIKESIRQKGMLDYIFVRHKELIEGKQTYWIVDGEQRWTACNDLLAEFPELKEMIVYDFGDISLLDAQELTLIYQAQVPMNVIKLAQLVKSMKEISDTVFLPFTDKALKSMVNLATYKFQDLTKDVNLVPERNMDNTNIIISCTIDQARIIREAIEVIKKVANQDMSDARSLELICADYLSSLNQNEKEKPKV